MANKQPYTSEHFLISCDFVDEMSDEELVSPFTGGVDLKTIKAEEKKLGLPITGSYLEFIKRYGSQEDEGWFGIDLKWGNMISERCKMFWKCGMPRNHIIVYTLGTDCFSINTDEATSPGEFTAYQFRTDFKSCSYFEVVGLSFAELWIRYFELEKKVQQAYKKKHAKK